VLEYGQSAGGEENSESGETLKNGTHERQPEVDISRFKFNDYLREKIGDPPKDMVFPHAHHILFKKGYKGTQQSLVKEGQDLLRRYGIDPVFGVENLVWAPNRIVGQHDTKALRYVVEQLKIIENFGGTPASIQRKLIKQLKLLGELAASRRNN